MKIEITREMLELIIEDYEYWTRQLRYSVHGNQPYSYESVATALKEQLEQGD
jgi:hypothetical protein